MKRRDFIKGTTGLGLLGLFLPKSVLAKLPSTEKFNPLFFVAEGFTDEIEKYDPDYLFCNMAYWQSYSREDLQDLFNKFTLSDHASLSNIVIGESESWNGTPTRLDYELLGKRLAKGIKNTCNYLIAQGIAEAHPPIFANYNSNSPYTCHQYAQLYYTHPDTYMSGGMMAQRYQRYGADSETPMRFYCREKCDYGTLSFARRLVDEKDVAVVQKMDVDYAIKQVGHGFDTAIVSGNTHKKILERNFNLGKLNICTYEKTTVFRRNGENVNIKVLPDDVIILWDSSMNQNSDGVRFGYTNSTNLAGYNVPAKHLSLVFNNKGKVYIDKDYTTWAEIAGIPIINPYSYGLIHL